MTLPHSNSSMTLKITGHAGASLQARRLGKELLVGIHSDESILENKGPTVMTLEER
jgi:ethanolamine-phosphate cytidylyltransferase